MNEVLVNNWNAEVQPQDRVYLLGDVAFSVPDIKEFIPRLRGRICLVPGNHEPTKIRKYGHLFDDIRGYVVKKGFIMSHIPLHTDSLARWKLNIHGHLHANRVQLQKMGGVIDDPRYFCACVEQIGYTPMLLDDILEERGLKL